MIISEVIAMLEKSKEEYGDIKLVQSCTSEGLLMPIRGINDVRNGKTGEIALVLDDDDEHYFGEIPPLEERK